MTRYREQIFPAAAEALWLVFLFLDLTQMADSTPVKFAAICLCLATACTGAVSLDGRLVALALGFTVGSDWFLLVRDDHYLLGLALFSVVQLLYALRLLRLRGNRLCPWGLALRLAALAAGALPGRRDPVVGLSVFYFANLAVNTAEAFSLHPFDRKQRRFAFGLLLFVGCDLCVGGWNLGLFPAFTRVGMWFFYLPSQVLIVLSQRLKGESS